jgi:alpha-L-arabinofuranosidase
MRLLLAAIAMLTSHLSAADLTLRVVPNRVLREGADRWLGINLNYIRDADANRPPGARRLDSALGDLGVRWLRYPGGEKSDFHRFATPPYATTAPLSLGWYAEQAGQRMDFDAYIGHCQAIGAEPYVVVACDSVARTGTSWDEQLEHAVAWVRYANRTKAYGVRWWEIGNENWHNQTASAATMATQVMRFSRAMKAVDPSIRIGASGNNRAWWSAFLPAAAADLDFLSLSAYNCWEWRSYDRLLRQPGPDLLGDARHALHAIDTLPPGERDRLRIIVAETNSVDYSPDGWARSNNLGHAIATFEIIGALLREPRISATMLWNTRWMNDDEAEHDQFYSFDAANAPTPTGLAVALWGRHLRSAIVAIEGGTDTCTAYASTNADGTTVWLVNRARSAQSGITLRFGRATAKASRQVLGGTGPDDLHPGISAAEPLQITDGDRTSLSCPPVSITVINASSDP